jgi:hypothetical protein
VAKLEIFYAVFDAGILRGPGAFKARHTFADKIARAWSRNIHRLTGATQLMLTEEDGLGTRTYIVTGEAGPRKHERVNLSAWQWLEYGTHKMRAQAPGRRALEAAAAEGEGP